METNFCTHVVTKLHLPKHQGDCMVEPSPCSQRTENQIYLAVRLLIIGNYMEGCSQTFALIMYLLCGLCCVETLTTPGKTKDA
uniref:Uncharacterized protein n=1 Tax=Pyxicephalus adspersus TaxID=30357 RepID=A0AAV3AX36_PYXAD|nr:TPA: hypothetical protein GDO54_011504 [Pyxicephalus adspersus]